MEANQLFSIALGLGKEWQVKRSEIDTEQRRLKLWLDFQSGTRFECPQCKQLCPVHDTVEKRWRHLDFWQHSTELIARVPRTKCEHHGVLQADVAWARPGSGFTLMMEGMILLLCQQMTVSAAASHLKENDHRLWRVLDHYVTKAHAAKLWNQVRRVMIDETSTRKGHRYATNFVDSETKALLFTTQGKDQETLAAFAVEMKAHGADPAQITEIVMDMSKAFIAGARKHFPQARLVFDHFHIMQLAGKAVDKVRKSLLKAGCDLKGSLWALRGNSWTRSESQQAARLRYMRDYPALGRAMSLRESLQDLLKFGDEKDLKWWCGWAARSRLEPFRDLSKTLKNHWQGILAFMETKLTNAAMEAINGILQVAKRMARGYRNFAYFRIAAYLKAGKLAFQPAFK